MILIWLKQSQVYCAYKKPCEILATNRYAIRDSRQVPEKNAGNFFSLGEEMTRPLSKFH